MTITKTHLLLTALILTAITSPAYPEPNQAPTPRIEFEMSEHIARRPGKGGGLPSQYLAHVFLRKPNSLVSEVMVGSKLARVFRRSLSLAFEGSISQEQQHFNNLHRFVTVQSGHIANQPRDTYWLKVHGVTLEDTKAMVKAMIKLGDDKACADLESTKNVLKELRKKKPLLDAEVAKLQQARQDAEKQFEQLKQSSFYKTEDQAQAALQEFNKTCQLLEIEITGIKAKLKVLKEHDGRFVDDMRLTEEVALAGALARLQATNRFRNAASAYVVTVEEQGRTTEAWEQKLRVQYNIEKRIEIEESTLVNPPADMKPVEIVGKVVIYPRK